MFPCAPGEKVPLRGLKWREEATLDPAKITAWWTEVPDANVAIATGGTVSGLYVVDVDSPDFDRSRLPETLIACTPRGGWHFYYASEVALGNTAGKLATGVDTRGVGGYVLAPPSRSKTGHSYTWANEVDPQQLPDWISSSVKTEAPPPQVQIIMPPREPPPVDGGSHYGLRALTEECEKIRNAAEGTRNNVLNTSAFKIWTLVGGGEIAEATAYAELESAAVACGLEQHEIRATLASAFRAGVASPRSRPEQTQVRVTHVRGFDVHTTIRDLEDAERETGAPVPVQPDEAMTMVLKEAYAPEARLKNMLETAGPNQVALFEQAKSIHARLCALPGLPGAYLRWTKETARYHQPALEIGSLLALGAMLGGRKYNMDGTTTTSYIAAIGATGDGKGHAQGALNTLLRASWSSLLGPSDFSSSASTITRIGEATAEGHAIGFVIDEYGPALSAIMDKRSMHQSALRGIILKLATAGTGDYSAPQSLARGGKDMLINAPCLVIFGSTTPSTLHEALGRASVDDGFLGRHLFFETAPTLPLRNKKAGVVVPTTELVEYVKAIREAHDEWRRSLPRDIDGPNGTAISMYEPENVAMEDVAFHIIDNFNDETDDFRRKSKDPMASALMARLAEHATRIAMILAIMLDHRRPVITEDIALLSVDIARYCGAVLNLSLTMHAAENDFERERKKLIRYLAARSKQSSDPAARESWVTKRDIMRALSGMTMESIDKLLARFEGEGLLQVSSTKDNPDLKHPGSGRNAQLYRLAT